MNIINLASCNELLVECAERPHTVFAFLVAARRCECESKADGMRENKMSPGSVFRRCRSNVDTRQIFKSRNSNGECDQRLKCPPQTAYGVYAIQTNRKVFGAILLPDSMCVCEREFELLF